jgi:hypothetical protein
MHRDLSRFDGQAVHVGRGQRSTRETRAGAASDERNLMLRAKANDRLNFVSGSRQEDGRRDGANRGQAIAFVGLQLAALNDYAAFADGACEVAKNFLGESGELASWRGCHGFLSLAIRLA